MNHTTDKNARPIANWLFTCAGFVFAMVIVGAITRLTNSGLSMVEWRPLMGALPPLNEAEWTRVFDLYKQSPEFAKEHFWMDLSAFKEIFFWEWFHRLLGRMIGLVYSVPLLWFWIKNKIPAGYKPKLIFLLILGGAQGLMGWYMVQSGLVDQPSVSHYRLAAHLSLALVIYGFLLWYGLSLWGAGPQGRAQKTFFVHGLVTFCFVAITIIWGAFTAGLDAGLLYNESFPKMGGHWVPPDALSLHPWWLNMVKTHAGVQLIHRWLAMATVVVVLSFWLHGIVRGQSSIRLHGLTGMVALQFSLGLLTLFSHVALPLAVLHQAGALIVLGLLISVIHQITHPPSHVGNS